MTHPTTIRLDDGEYRQLRQLAEDRDTTVSELVRQAIRRTYFSESRADDVDTLLDFIDEHPAEVSDDPDIIDRRIDEAMGDAAG